MALAVLKRNSILFTNLKFIVYLAFYRQLLMGKISIFLQDKVVMFFEFFISLFGSMKSRVYILNTQDCKESRINLQVKIAETALSIAFKNKKQCKLII